MLKSLVRLFPLAACLLSTAAALHAQTPFAERFERIRAGADPAQLYALLYDLPKGGDLHHHLGGDGLPEDWYAIASNPARNGGNAFYTRVRLAHYEPDENAQPILFRTIQKSTFDALPAARQEDYAPMAGLTPEQRDAWESSLILDHPNEGRDGFFFRTPGRAWANCFPTRTCRRN